MCGTDLFQNGVVGTKTHKRVFKAKRIQTEPISFVVISSDFCFRPLQGISELEASS